MLENKDKMAIEIGGHDHWADLRVYNSKKYGPYRNIYVPAGIGNNQG